MTTNRLAKSDTAAPNQCPPDMPRGKTAEDKAARQRYWIDRGNARLAEDGRHDLQWAGKDGFYWLEPR